MKVSSLFEKYYRPGTSCLLESASIHESTGRYSVIATQPEFIFKSWGNLIEIKTKSENYWSFGDPLSKLREIFKERKVEYKRDLPPFTGGAVGYIGYDTVRLWENLGSSAVKDIDIPDIYLLFYDNVIVVDHIEDKIFEFGCNLPSNVSIKSETDLELKFRPSLSKEAFCDMVLKAKEYISNGDIYQANLSQRLVASGKCDGWALYKKLCDINPSPFGGFFDLDGLQLISCSPERLVKVQGETIETRPIAGTYPRGKTFEDDKMKKRQLILNPKERAEHIMLLDLERNDLGRVCEYGSVEVDQHMVVESYSHVHHIVSNVIGKKREENDTIDILKAVFPGGTITGCPKIRCMQIIDELEPVRRNVYTGCMGWIGYNGNMDLNIIIRSILKFEDKLSLQVGAGIVADSVPEREYDETLHKARALLEAVSSDRRQIVKHSS